MSDPKFFCDKCNCKCRDATDWEKHNKTKKHNSDGTRPKFECNLCNYSCNIVSVFDKHKSTFKHKMRQMEFDKSNECTAKEQSNGYKLIASDSDIMTIVKQLLSQNNELKNFIIEQASEHKKETSEIVNKVIEQTNKVLDTVKPSIANTINNNNQKFNINLFLTEQCKDAMNFSDFIKNITVSREDLENNAQLGFVNGVSKILIDHLNRMSVNERPIHCTDIKRETMYIKDDDKWTREEDSTKINKVIQEVTRKSMISLLDWKDENPDDKDRDSAFSERCIVIQQQSMAAYNRDTYFPKVARAIAKEVMVDK